MHIAALLEMKWSCCRGYKIYHILHGEAKNMDVENGNGRNKIEIKLNINFADQRYENKESVSYRKRSFARLPNVLGMLPVNLFK